ncbi:hypothetical protein Pelo_4007 [Pelomyxa schiedti]|nr:hypothetical protein Pelo_4007 [Pelomyxa schiedti]
MSSGVEAALVPLDSTSDDLQLVVPKLAPNPADTNNHKRTRGGHRSGGDGGAQSPPPPAAAPSPYPPSAAAILQSGSLLGDPTTTTTTTTGGGGGVVGATVQAEPGERPPGAASAPLGTGGGGDLILLLGNHPSSPEPTATHHSTSKVAVVDACTDTDDLALWVANMPSPLYEFRTQARIMGDRDFKGDKPDLLSASVDIATEKRKEKEAAPVTTGTTTTNILQDSTGPATAQSNAPGTPPSPTATKPQWRLATSSPVLSSRHSPVISIERDKDTSSEGTPELDLNDSKPVETTSDPKPSTLKTSSEIGGKEVAPITGGSVQAEPDKSSTTSSEKPSHRSSSDSESPKTRSNSSSSASSHEHRRVKPVVTQELIDLDFSSTPTGKFSLFSAPSSPTPAAKTFTLAEVTRQLAAERTEEPHEQGDEPIDMLRTLPKGVQVKPNQQVKYADLMAEQHRMDQVADSSFMLVILGDENVGKTSLVHCAVHGTPPLILGQEHDSDQSVTIVRKVNGKRIKLLLSKKKHDWFLRIPARSVFGYAQGFIVMFDVTRPDTYDHATKWVDDIHRFSKNPDAPILLLANKIDLSERLVPKELAIQFSGAHTKGLYVETSISHNRHVEKAFNMVLKNL